jgi:hypothetical protein
MAKTKVTQFEPEVNKNAGNTLRLPIRQILPQILDSCNSWCFVQSKTKFFLHSPRHSLICYEEQKLFAVSCATSG